MNKIFYAAMMFGLALGTTAATGCALDPAPDGDRGDADVSETDSALTAADPVSQRASDKPAVTELGKGGVTTQSIEIRTVTCNSGWPGTRGCSWRFSSASAITPGSITVAINGHNGEIGHTLSQIDAFTIDFTASVNEGDAFNPGKNTTSYTVAWLR
jgi:hypothetical protein